MIGKLTMPQLSMYMRNIPEVQKRVEAGNATLSWLTAAVHGNESKYTKWFSAYAQTSEPPLYEADLAMDMRTAIRLGLMSENMFRLLDTSEVARSLIQIKDR